MRQGFKVRSALVLGIKYDDVGTSGGRGAHILSIYCVIP